MPIFLILFVLFVLVTITFGFRFWSKRQTHIKLLRTPLSDHQIAIVSDQVPLVQKLPFEEQGRLEGKINAFLHQVKFIGCGGLEITEEMRLSIAAQACLLIVNNDMWYKHLSTILIYPGAFKSREKEYNGYVVTERETVRSGESWSRGPVVLSWSHSKQGAINDGDGQNVVLHEFAHRIDDLSGHTDGAPILNQGQSFADWERVFIKAYKRHVQSVEKGRKTVIDVYGAEGQEEFFAVSVEVFFEKPVALKREEPMVYQQLSELFRLDPTDWQ